MSAPAVGELPVTARPVQRIVGHAIVQAGAFSFVITRRRKPSLGNPVKDNFSAPALALLYDVDVTNTKT